MDASRGIKLLCSLWPKIDIALSEETRSDRIRFISSILQCFGENGVDLSQVVNLDEDIRFCVQHLDAKPSKPRRRIGQFVLDTSGLGDPIDYELLGGPFDGTSIRIGSGLSEMPPGLVTFTAGEHSTRLNGDAIYKLQQVTERDSDGTPVCEYLAYEHVTENTE